MGGKTNMESTAQNLERDIYSLLYLLVYLAVSAMWKALFCMDSLINIGIRTRLRRNITEMIFALFSEGEIGYSNGTSATFKIAIAMTRMLTARIYSHIPERRSLVLIGS